MKKYTVVVEGREPPYGATGKCRSVGAKRVHYRVEGVNISGARAEALAKNERTHKLTEARLTGYEYEGWK